jgi:hypothetical protein
MWTTKNGGGRRRRRIVGGKLGELLPLQRQKKVEKWWGMEWKTALGYWMMWLVPTHRHVWEKTDFWEEGELKESVWKGGGGNDEQQRGGEEEDNMFVGSRRPSPFFLCTKWGRRRGRRMRRCQPSELL